MQLPLDIASLLQERESRAGSRKPPVNHEQGAAPSRAEEAMSTVEEIRSKLGAPDFDSILVYRLFPPGTANDKKAELTAREGLERAAWGARYLDTTVSIPNDGLKQQLISHGAVEGANNLDVDTESRTVRIDGKTFEIRGTHASGTYQVYLHGVRIGSVELLQVSPPKVAIFAVPNEVWDISPETLRGVATTWITQLRFEGII
jgi:hypothetical protein